MIRHRRVGLRLLACVAAFAAVLPAAPAYPQLPAAGQSGGPAVPQPAGDTFVAALAEAYATSPELAAARAGLRATDEQVPQALAGWRPTVSITGSAGPQDYNVHSSVPGLSYRQTAWGPGVQLNQPVYQGGRVGASVKRAEDTVRAGRADLLGTEQNVLLAAATAYHQVVRDRALLAVTVELERLLGREVREITIRQEAGQLTVTDVNEAASRLAQAKADRLSAEGNLTASLASYRAAVGSPPPAQLAPTASLSGLPESEAQAIELADTNSQAVIGSLFRARAAASGIDVARAALLPNLALSLSAGTNYGQTYPKLRTAYATATLNLDVPLYQGGAASSGLRQAKETAAQSRLQILVSRRDAEENAARAFALWRSAGAAEREETERVRLAGAAFEGARRQAAVGATSTFELLGQLQLLYNAQSAVIAAHYNVRVDECQLLVAIGRFTAADQHLPVTIYDPVVHYNDVRDRGSLLP